MNHRALKLRELIDTDRRFNGFQKAFADRVGLTVGQVNQWLSGHRNMKDTTAREIEIKLGYEAGWFEISDAIKKNNSPEVHGEQSLSPLESEALTVFRQLPSDNERNIAIETMRLRVNTLANSKGNIPARKKA